MLKQFAADILEPFKSSLGQHGGLVGLDDEFQGVIQLIKFFFQFLGMIPIFRQSIFLGFRHEVFKLFFGHFQFDTLADHAEAVHHRLLFFRIEFLGFDQDPLLDSDFSKIMEQGGIANFVHLVMGKTQGTKRSAIQLMGCFGQSDGQGRDAA